MSSGIVAFRVDDRMLHGIVATQWVPSCKATRAMVIDPPSSVNDIVRSSLKMACPAGVALSVLDTEKAAENILAEKYASQRVFCVFRYIKWAYILFQAGVKIPQLNLGNVTQNKGETLELNKTVRVSPEEKSMLREMRDAGVIITVRFAIDDREVNVGKLLD
jgi:PTS system mannose-specific IIB component